MSSIVVKMLTISPYFQTTETPHFWFQRVGSSVIVTDLRFFVL